jgi:DsbE subfamily thiol:disulfide oxidoreductase
MAKARTLPRRRAKTQPIGLWLGLIVGVALILLSVFLFTKQSAGVDANAAALSVPLENLNGAPVKLSDYRGKFVLVNLWATWCPPCRAELPDLIRFYEQHQANGLEFVAINTQDERASALQYMRDHNMTFTVPFDPQGRVLYAWTDGALPDTFLLDRDGRIVFKWTGQISPAILEERLAPILTQ